MHFLLVIVALAFGAVTPFISRADDFSDVAERQEERPTFDAYWSAFTQDTTQSDEDENN
ncbi:MAG: hypothetical protein ABW199_03595 [Caulobacterales bacterium]